MTAPNKLPPEFPYCAFHWTDAQRRQYEASRRYSWPHQREVEHLRGADGHVHWPAFSGKRNPWDEPEDYPDGLSLRERLLRWLRTEFGR